MPEKQKPMPLFNILLAVRDSRLTKKGERLLLDAIALRVNPAKGYTCWPSYDLLALDTGLHPSTLKKLAEKLEKKGLIYRRIRHNSSNLFALNIGRIVHAAEINRAADKAKKDAATAADAFAADFASEADDSSAPDEQMEYLIHDPIEYNDPFPDQDSL